MPFLRAHLLISAPRLHDPNFRHTVVLIGNHDENGAAGVILNRPLDVTVAEAVPPLAEYVAAQAKLFEGGPVQVEQPVLLVELRGQARPSVPIFGNIGFFTGEIDETVRASIVRARVFAGYSGWGAGQLEGEMELDAWITEPALPDDVFSDDPAGLWKRVLERKGGEYMQIAMVPKDPRVN